MPSPIRMALAAVGAAILMRATVPAVAGRTSPIASPTIAALQQAVDAGQPDAVRVFWDRIRAAGTPLIEKTPDDSTSSLVTFVWRATPPVSAVVVKFSGSSQLTSHAELDKARMTRLGETDVWFLTWRLPNTARFTYELSPDDPLTLLPDLSSDKWGARLARFAPDPLNPRRFDGRSLAQLPAAAPPLDAGDRPRRPVEEHRFTSGILGNQRTVFVYRTFDGPPGRRASLIVTLDGDTFAGAIGLPAVLDSLTDAGRLGPMVAVMVGNAPGRRLEELHYSADFARAMATELVPWIRHRLHVNAAASRTAIVGSSLGGNAALFTAFVYPETFGAAVSLSGGYQARQHLADASYTRQPMPGEIFEPAFPDGEWLTGQFAEVRRRRLRIALGVGLFEDITEHFHAAARLFGQPSLLVATRHLRDVLIARGYEVGYQEVPGAHEPLTWQSLLPGALTHVLPGR